MDLNRVFSDFAGRVARISGSPAAFGVCVLAILLWALTGPLFGFSETWQLIINTGTTIVTFLMVFLIQNTQNRDGKAIQTKLDELIRASDAEDEFMGIEKLTDRELDVLHAKCQKMAANSHRLLEQTDAEKKSRQGARSKGASKAAVAPRRRSR